MAGKLSKPLGLRLQESTINYYSDLAKEDKRLLVDYLRIVLEAIEEKGLTWQQLSGLPNFHNLPHPPPVDRVPLEKQKD